MSAPKIVFPIFTFMAHPKEVHTDNTARLKTDIKISNSQEIKDEEDYDKVDMALEENIAMYAASFHPNHAKLFKPIAEKLREYYGIALRHIVQELQVHIKDTHLEIEMAITIEVFDQKAVYITEAFLGMISEDGTIKKFSVHGGSHMFFLGEAA